MSQLRGVMNISSVSQWALASLYGRGFREICFGTKIKPFDFSDDQFEEEKDLAPP